jgi:hypothetical protein
MPPQPKPYSHIITVPSLSFLPSKVSNTGRRQDIRVYD